jgi:hypothetical protein
LLEERAMSILPYAWVSGFALSLCAASLALAQEYPSGIAKSDPVAIRAWRAIVPPEFRKQGWIYSLQGTETPIQNTSLHGKPSLSGSLCIPHDCGGNFVAFLIANDGSEAYGELASETLRVKQRYFGAPDAEARAALDKLVNQ